MSFFHQHASPVTELLDLVDRHAPRFLKGGGVGCSAADNDHNGRAVPAADLLIILTLFQEQRTAGRVDFHAIAEASGYSYSTVVKLTRPLRPTRRNWQDRTA